MDTSYLLSEIKLDESSYFSSSDEPKIEKSKSKRKPTLHKQSSSSSECSPRTNKASKMNSIIKPKIQKITSIFIKSKYWKRKKFLAVEPNVSEIQVHDKLIIFNNEQIESYYHDMQPENIFKISHNINQIVSVNKNNIDRILEINLSSPYENKQHTFKFMIDHFRRVPNPLYSDLCVELEKYQTYLSTMYYRLHKISKQISKQETYHNEVLITSNQLLNDIKQQVTQYMNFKNNEKSNCYNFSFYKIQKVNYESKTYELVQQGISYDLKNLIIPNSEKNENLPLYTYSQLLQITKQYDGEQRIITQTKLLEAMNQCQSDISDVKITLQTFDQIDLNCTANVHFVYPSQIPNWMGKQDINAQIWSFSISEEQLQQIQLLRSQCNTVNEYSIDDNIEYSINRDLFYSKFYPDMNIGM